MAKSYTPAPEPVLDMLQDVIKRWHSDVEKAGVTFDAFMVANDSGPAIMVRGQQALACVKAMPEIERAQGTSDVRLLIDAEEWEKLSDPQRIGLLDHEVYHVKPVRDDKNGGFKLDSEGRPKIAMRKHDVEVGWFVEVAERHKDASPEVSQAKRLYDNFGQAFWPFLTEIQPGLKLMPEPKKTAA